MGTGFIHVNGTTYELAYPPSDLTGLRDRLHENAPSQTVDVRIGGASVSLRVFPHHFATFAVWSTEDAAG